MNGPSPGEARQPSRTAWEPSRRPDRLRARSGGRGDAGRPGRVPAEGADDAGELAAPAREGGVRRTGGAEHGVEVWSRQLLAAFGRVNRNAGEKGVPGVVAEQNPLRIRTGDGGFAIRAAATPQVLGGEATPTFLLFQQQLVATVPFPDFLLLWGRSKGKQVPVCEFTNRLAPATPALPRLRQDRRFRLIHTAPTVRATSTATFSSGNVPTRARYSW